MDGKELDEEFEVVEVHSILGILISCLVFGTAILASSTSDSKLFD